MQVWGTQMTENRAELGDAPWSFPGRNVPPPNGPGGAVIDPQQSYPDEDSDCFDALELAVEMAEAIRLSDTRIAALEAENVQMRTEDLELRTDIADEVAALQSELEAAANRAAKAEAAILAIADRERVTLERAERAEDCLGRVRDQLQRARQTTISARQARAASAR